MFIFILPNLAMGASPVGATAVLTLREAIAAWLRSQATVTAIVGNRIYWAQPSQASSYPCVTVKVTARTYGYNLAGADGTSLATVSITPMGLYESQCIALAEAVRNVAQGFRGTQSGVAILTCYLDDESDDESPPPDGSANWIYQTPIPYKIAHRVPAPTSVTQSPA
jgi:hypothetical protein